MENTEHFSDRVEALGGKALDILDQYFDGKTQGLDKVAAAMNILGRAVQVRHQDQLRRQIDRSQNLRTAQFILEDPEAKRAYIAAMHPEIKKFLPAPKKGKD